MFWKSGSTGFRRRFRRRFGRFCCKTRSGSTGFWEALVQSRVRLVQGQVRFKRVPEKVKVPEKVWEACCRGRSGSTGFWRRWCRARSGSTGFHRVLAKVPEKFLRSLGAKPSQV